MRGEGIRDVVDRVALGTPDVEVVPLIRGEERNTRWLLQPREKDFWLSELTLGCKEREAIDDTLISRSD